MYARRFPQAPTHLLAEPAAGYQWRLTERDAICTLVQDMFEVQDKTR